MRRRMGKETGERDSRRRNREKNRENCATVPMWLREHHSLI